jgi:hypothetical protein
MDRRIPVAVVGVSFLFVMAVLAVHAAQAPAYYGPSFVVPVSVSLGGIINITLTTGSGNSVVPLPQGSSPPCSGTCIYPQQDWNSSAPGAPGNCFYSINEVAVTDPSGDEYMLGSNVTSGLYWPSDFGGGGGGTHVPPQAAALNLTVGDMFTIPFGSGAGNLSFVSVLGNPPNDVSPAGPYYWWTVASNVYGSNVRLDQNSSINPTIIMGTYTLDIQGVVACPAGSETFGTTLFFDSGFAVIVPQTTTSTTSSNSVVQTTTVAPTTVTTIETVTKTGQNTTATETVTEPGQTTATTTTETTTSTIYERSGVVTATETVLQTETQTIKGGTQVVTQVVTTIETQPVEVLTQTQTATTTETMSGVQSVSTTTQTVTGQGQTGTITEVATMTTTRQPNGVIVASLAGVAVLAIIICIILGLVAAGYLGSRRKGAPG